MIEAIETELALPPDALELTWRSLAEVGNLSSSSVLHVLRDTLDKRSPDARHARRADGDGPGFCAELVLLRVVNRCRSGTSLLIAAVALERVAELVISRRNLDWSRRQGGREYGQSHYPVMVVLHTGLLVGCLVEVGVAHRPFIAALGWPMLALVVAAQALRWWCIADARTRWNTRIVVVDGLALVARRALPAGCATRTTSPSSSRAPRCRSCTPPGSPPSPSPCSTRRC